MPTPSTIFTLTLPSGEKRRRSLDFDTIKLRLAPPEEILEWSHGEVTKPETINYRSRKPERDGLFCEKIFGPVRDWQCACGKYKKLRYRGITCDRCGVEVTRSLVRRERMGHITLAAPVAHIWFLRSVPSKVGLLLDLSVQSLEKVVYFANFIITEVNEEFKKEALQNLEKELKQIRHNFSVKGADKELEKNKESTSKEGDLKSQELMENYHKVRQEIMDLKPKKLLTELQYRDLSLKYGHIFEADIGAEAVLKLLQNINLGELTRDLEKEKNETDNPMKKKKIVQRLKYVRNFMVNKIKPEYMILKIVPVIPPDLRPLVPLDGGRFASSDLNDLYRRVINRNNRLKRLYELHAPEVILRNEKRMLQEAVDALLDNEMRSGKTTIASTGQRRSLKSLADILKGKQGRFRQNLLGKRVDYSGRSVIVVGPRLKLHQCGLPKIMALELFKPFIAAKLIERGFTHNIKSANRLIESGTDDVWAILEEITKNTYVLLNRAPTLHRLGVQAFQPVLIEGKAIQIHPLVCAAFNADFDGDQMAVHLPITAKAQQEAKEIILSTKNLLKPATGEPIVTPTKDMIWGAYYMTSIEDETDNKSKMLTFGSVGESILAYQLGKISLQKRIKVRINGEVKQVSVGRVIFNSILPPDIYSLDTIVNKSKLNEIIVNIIEKYGTDKAVESLDLLKETTLSYLTHSGLSWGMDDLPSLPEKSQILQQAEKDIDQIRSQYEMGLLSEQERYLKSIEVWIAAKDKITEMVKKNQPASNSVFSMVEAGARGSWMQLTQMFGMRGIVSSPTGRLIELPIKSSFKEGFNVLEFFISTHGSRKGVSDTALRTASAGYLTRRIVDVCQDVIITEKDCHDTQGIKVTREDNREIGEGWRKRLFGRVAAQPIRNPKTKKIIVKADEIISQGKAKEIEAADPEEVFIRSVLTCQSVRGVCSQCYGYDLGYNQPVKVGAPVGIIAAQSIGEPGTQLTLRTFHTGGVAGHDITQGLPRVQELFEVRPIKRKAVLALDDGVIKIIREPGQQKLIVKYSRNNRNPASFKKTARTSKKIDSGNEEEYDITGYSVWVKDGEKVVKGQRLTDGSLDLHELYELRGRREVEKYILKEIQYIYSSQGQRLNDKHVEVVIRQMFSRYLVEDAGDTDLLPGEVIPRSYLLEVNKLAEKRGKKSAEAKELLLGVTRVSLSIDSWLSAASFQETSRILVNTAVSGRADHLRGLKENVIVGRLIPAGTGYATVLPRKSQ